MEQQHYSNHGAVRNETKPNGHRRAFAHDYHAVGTYMVTIVAEGRARVFGHIEGSAVATRQLDREAWVRDSAAPHIVLSELGRRVLEEEVPKISRFYPQVEVWRVAMMPDHIHLLLRVKEPLPEGKHLGMVVSGFKSGCSRAWWRLLDEARVADEGQPVGEPTGTAASPLAVEGASALAVEGASALAIEGASALVVEGASPLVVEDVEDVAVDDVPRRWVGDGVNVGLLKVARGILRAIVPEGSPSGCGGGAVPPASHAPVPPASQAPLPPASSGNPAHWARYPLLFSSGYHDRIINRPGMLDNIKRYMLENPLRARIREECPQLMQRQLHLWIAGREYAAFGNLFLLKYPLKEQVFFHRYTPVGAGERDAILAAGALTEKERAHVQRDPDRMPTHLTEAYRREHARLLRVAEEGTVLVTPGISKGESLIVSAAIDAQLPLILMQKEPITRYWKPSERRFYACTAGHLLILAPWQLDDEISKKGEVNGYAVGGAGNPVGDYARFHHLNDLAQEICGARDMRIIGYNSLLG